MTVWVFVCGGIFLLLHSFATLFPVSVELDRNVEQLFYSSLSTASTLQLLVDPPGTGTLLFLEESHSLQWNKKTSWQEEDKYTNKNIKTTTKKWHRNRNFTFNDGLSILSQYTLYLHAIKKFHEH